MASIKRTAFVCMASVLLPCLGSCALGSLVGHLSYAVEATDPLASYLQVGDTTPILDPSIIQQGGTYYAFSTDVAGPSSSGFLPIHCSQDKLSWTTCGNIFPEALPAWVINDVPGITGLWAPDVSFFNGEYHVYYTGSVLYSQRSVIGLVTNTTLDASDPDYKWVDHGQVLASKPGDDFNALDPTILVDSDTSVWLTYGSYWTGIKQLQIDPDTGMLLASNSVRYDLATRPGVPNNPIEGASLIHRGGYYYLFVSVDYCCEQNPAANDYKEAVGRSTGPHGPFTDEAGTAMMNGGGTVLLEGDGAWIAPGGATAYVNSADGESLIIFHAHRTSENNTPFVWIKSIQWTNDWPVISN
jgi:arabinan endo-1,5-alpha-L-arabinosidase